MRQNLLSLLAFGLLNPVHVAGNACVRQLYQFPNTTFHDIENVAIRPNGHLLLNTITEPVLYTLDPSAIDPIATPLHHFDNATGLGGITEVSPDVFAVVVGNYSVHEFKGIPGTFSIWLVDLKADVTSVKKLTSIPEALTLNGITTASKSVIMVADSPVGIIYSINIDTGCYQIGIQDAHFQPPPSSPFPLGINGIHRRDDTLYFTNSGQGTFGSLLITDKGNAAGQISIIANAPPGNFYDDFAIDSRNNPSITIHPSSIETLMLPSGAVSSIINSTEIVHPTSCVFGNSRDTKRTLYVVTAGDASGSQIISGQVLAITPC
ncbi:hypothetical protein BJX66DRAFT_343909 [Aspergillus keveii]|uniref:SMP-30/Gluconolactonase/LRE-like region domain-containing protein n=1 Tax=Aspergillus keveii TaxID=714993 RepID=A0ABR4FMT3_9EURO